LPTIPYRQPRGQGFLVGTALVAIWLATALIYALLAQPTSTFTTLHARGTRGLPAVMWAGSRDLVRLLRDHPESTLP
jgi:hypothetical protein